MGVTKPAIGAFLLVAGAYAVYPYVTLYRLGEAIRHGDAVTLQSMVDWPAVREGIKEDICDLVIDDPPEVKVGSKLPAFGAGFVRGIAQNAVDARVNPESLAAAAKQPAMPNGASVQVSWAFFSGPSAFVVDLNAPGQSSPIRLELDLRDGGWQVTRVWLPPELLTQANART
ncbi:MAG TPA: DUF2939 domain-containing protein [Acetobacteraceae bacterium]|jgi:hypothetical protein|nr:DUF2939 domain-containing protein [Acetobacteraceae bacterium]